MPHVHEKIDFTTDVFVVYKDTVLLRMHDKYKVWAGPGGHIELDEDPNETIVREAKEEVGLDITLIDVAGHTQKLKEFPEGSFRHRELIPPQFLNRHNVSPTHEHVDLIYFATAATNVINPGKGETAVETHWFTEKELDDPKYHIAEHIKYYAKAALKALA